MQKLTEIMTREVRSVAPTHSLQQAAQLMLEHNVGSVPVCEGRKVVGIVTDRDIAVRSTAKGADPKTTKVSDIMSKEVDTCLESASVEDVARQMREKQIRRLPVVDKDRQLLGIVALADVANSTVSEHVKSEGLEGVSRLSGS